LKIITSDKNIKDFQNWKRMFEENELMRNKYRIKVLAFGHPQGNMEEIYKVIETESLDKIQEMLKQPEMKKLRTEAVVDLETQKFIMLEGGNQD
tara:strand:- start:291 stop:572 length:282 start_codon:yes stop_codon:yes gene_type:complete